MELYAKLPIVTHETFIQENITPESMDQFCESMFLLTTKNGTYKVGSMWGEFDLSYNKIKGGVRFSLLDCPNALAWTITTGYHEIKSEIQIHMIINRKDIKENFEEELKDFLNEWKTGLASQFNK